MRINRSMRAVKTLATLGIIFITVSCASFQHTDITDINKRESIVKNAQCIEFTQKVYNFGVTGQGEIIEHDFQFKNVGSSILKIEDIDTDCGCTIAEPSSKSFQPGEVGYIKAEFKTISYYGKQEKSILIYSNDPKNPKVELLMTGTVTKDIGLQSEVIYFGEVEKSDKVTRKVRIFQIGSDVLRINRIESSSKYLQIIQARFDEPNSRGIELTVTLKPDFPIGIFNEVITLHTNIKRRPRVDIPVYGKIMGDIQVSSQALSLGKVKKGEKIPDRLNVFSRKKNPFLIKDIRCDLPYVNLFFHPDSKARAEKYAVGVEIGKNAPSGKLAAKIYIVTDLKEEPIIEIPVYGIISNQ